MAGTEFAQLSGKARMNDYFVSADVWSHVCVKQLHKTEIEYSNIWKVQCGLKCL